MPVLYDFRGEVLELRAIGRYARADVATTFRLALADPARPTLRALLYDVRESQEVGSRSTPDVREAVALRAQTGSVQSAIRCLLEASWCFRSKTLDAHGTLAVWRP